MVKKKELPKFLRWQGFWSLWTSVRFLKTYLKSVRNAAFIPQSAGEVQTLLDMFLLEKAVYELGYELNNRQTWI